MEKDLKLGNYNFISKQRHRDTEDLKARGWNFCRNGGGVEPRRVRREETTL